ncbi:hypothetical protein V3H18_03230 [Methylocystis sp. 9N]|uniref:GlsB/YeaQ/YmgE family stress response membrane protein n=1 Tax=Methylocystis borbori TaxID=3118750 RepID=A0ABU7XG69_9HYPH
MDQTLLDTARIIGAPNAQFLVLLLIGGLIGWCIVRISHLGSVGALALAGVTGAWLAAEFGFRLGLADRCAGALFVAGAVGAALCCMGWRAIHPDHDIAVGRGGA